MSITFEHKLQVIDGFVVVPGMETVKSINFTVANVLAAIPGATIGRLFANGSGLTLQDTTHRDNVRHQTYIVLPSTGIADGTYQSDWHATLRALA